jgi:hypothetical protein
MKKGEREKKGNRRDTRISKVLPPYPHGAMAEHDWTPSSITSGHPQKLVKHGFMTAAELTTCSVLEDPAFPTPAEGYVVSFMAFYEWGFSMPLHWFLYSLLQHYDLEVHHLTPSRVLHIVAFVTLCEAYLGIDPELDL